MSDPQRANRRSCHKFCSLAAAILLSLATAYTHAADDILLLVATPDLEGSIFEQSVILVAPHDSGAAMGVILNQPLPVDSAQIYPRDELLRQAGVIHFGGPVEPGLLLFIFRSAEKPEDALHLFDDIYASTSRELLANQMKRPRDESGLQLYMGYSGWSVGQLQHEILRGSWDTVKATSTHIFGSDRRTLWQALSGNKDDKWI